MKTTCSMWLAAGILILTLAGCGDDRQPGKTTAPPASAGEKSIDPCALLTGAEIQAALGWKVDKAEAKGYGATGTCNYSSATPYTAQGLQQLSIVIGYGMPDMRSAEAMAKWRLEQYSGDAYQGIIRSSGRSKGWVCRRSRTAWRTCSRSRWPWATSW